MPLAVKYPRNSKEQPLNTIYENRLKKIRQVMKKKELDTFLVSIEENRRYLSGYTGEDSQFDETAGVLIITDSKLILATDSRFTLQAKKEAPLFDVYQYQKGLAKELPAILDDLASKRMGFESKRMSFFQYKEMMDEINSNKLSVEVVPLDNMVENLRLIKDETEIEKTRNALKIAETVFTDMLNVVKPGMTEKQAAWIMEVKMREAGADSLSFPTICASGPNSALPHAIPEDRMIQNGEPLLFDWGDRLNGYCSDTSRTLFLGKPDDMFTKVYETVREAQKRAMDAIKPGKAVLRLIKLPGILSTTWGLRTSSDMAWATEPAWRSTKARD